VAEHISRKELKTDRIHDAIEHSAEAVFSHKQVMLLAVLAALLVAAGWGGWSVYHDRQTAAASAEFETAMKAYEGRIGGAPDPSEPREVTYPDEKARATDALAKFTAAADKYPNTNPGRLARYYAALCLEDLERQNQALESLKKLTAVSSPKELPDMAKFQIAIIQARSGKPDDAVKIFRELADKSSVFVPRPLALLELANTLRQSNPKEAANVYQQIKKEFPDSAVSEEADRGLELLAAKS
jgi:predicted negative regulator of RcsB-dependent stress response